MHSLEKLTRKWQQIGIGELTDTPFHIRLNSVAKEKLEALCERYPRISKDEIIRDLLSAALKDVEAGLPYQPGNKIIAWDDCGDEIYEDCGLTPRLLERTKHYQTQLRQVRQS
ncbi:MAG: type 1 pili tip component [Cellvibrionaceae bacterium]